MKKLFIFTLLLAFNTVVFAQEAISEGVVTTKQILSTDNEAMQAQLAMMGDIISTTYFKETKSRVEVSNPMSGDVVVIADAESLESLTLMDNPMMGKKFQLTTIDPNAVQFDNMKIEDGTETKTILGYECKEKILSYSENGNELKMIFFTTDKIRPVLNQQTIKYGEQIGGFPLYSKAVVNQGGMMITVETEVTEVKAEKVDDSKFNMTPPEGYTEM